LLDDGRIRIRTSDSRMPFVYFKGNLSILSPTFGSGSYFGSRMDVPLYFLKKTCEIAKDILLYYENI